MKISLIIILALAATSTHATAQSFVLGDSKASDCYRAADRGDKGGRSSILVCQSALKTPGLSPTDKVSTYVNLGVLQMRRGSYVDALASMEAAVELNPDLAEAHLNKGACLIYMGRPAEAIVALDTSLTLGTHKEVEARYNRAISLENLERYDEAYMELQTVLDLRPDWEPALQAISRYSVVDSQQAG